MAIFDKSETDKKLDEARLQLRTLTKVLRQKSLTPHELKMVESSEAWLKRHFDFRNVLRNNS